MLNGNAKWRRKKKCFEYLKYVLFKQTGLEEAPNVSLAPRNSFIKGKNQRDKLRRGFKIDEWDRLASR